MSDEWQLRRCDCGNSFGSNSSKSPTCSRCGSPKSTVVSIFDDSRQLAVAVSNANMPKEIAQDIAKRIRVKDEKSIKNSSVSGDQHSKMIRAMNEATDESGILTKEALLIELEGLGTPDVSVEHLIGMAELEGLLLRRDGESWTWLQQSS
ncbi:MAG: hypothetical protein VX626_04680 [Candidatus Thermoplasmatota archaeon]|nr:hypothetical protein [Candidatus Thermoplasmatota archaeon]